MTARLALLSALAIAALPLAACEQMGMPGMGPGAAAEPATQDQFAIERRLDAMQRQIQELQAQTSALAAELRAGPN